jgi:hypothetical protein
MHNFNYRARIGQSDDPARFLICPNLTKISSRPYIWRAARLVNSTAALDHFAGGTATHIAATTCSTVSCLRKRRGMNGGDHDL